MHDHHQDKADQLEETTEAFEGCDYQAEVETGMASEIKIAEIVEMHCEEEFLTEDEDNTDTELVFDEFEEIVGRMFHLREWVQVW